MKRIDNELLKLNSKLNDKLWDELIRELRGSLYNEVFKFRGGLTNELVNGLRNELILALIE